MGFTISDYTGSGHEPIRISWNVTKRGFLLPLLKWLTAFVVQYSETLLWIEWDMWKWECQVIQFVTFLCPSWRSLNPWKGHLTIPKRAQRIARWEQLHTFSSWPRRMGKDAKFLRPECLLKGHSVWRELQYHIVSHAMPQLQEISNRTHWTDP